MIKIEKIKTRKILNSQGKIAIETEIITNKNTKGIAQSPSAIIPGKREIKAEKEINNNELNTLINEIYNTNIESQEHFDSILNKHINKLGANLCLSLSLAFARAYSKSKKLSLVNYISELGNITDKNINIKPLIAIFSSRCT